MTNGTQSSEGVDRRHWDLTQQNTDHIADLMAGQGRLEAGFASMREEVRGGMGDIRSVIQQNNKPLPRPQIIAGATLALGAVLALGGVLGFTFSIITSGMQRESDQRFEQQQNAINRIYVNAEKDNERELSDAYEDGKRDQSIADTSAKLDHIDELTHARTTAVNQWVLGAAKDIQKTATGVRAMGDYMKEHAAKQGSAGHPAPERIIGGSIKNLMTETDKP